MGHPISKNTILFWIGRFADSFQLLQRRYRPDFRMWHIDELHVRLRGGEAYVYVAEDDTVRENLRLAGPRVVSFNNVLKWHSIPLAEALTELLRVLSKGMGCAVEVEFAVDMGDLGRSVPRGVERRTPTLYVLQIRPLATHFKQQGVDHTRHDPDELVCWTDRSLGQGVINDVRDIVYVKRDALDVHTTKDVAKQVGELNARLRADKIPFVLIGPGRWGTSDPRLGIPVEWKQIARARVIAETPLEGMEVEPSQGTHFFQNITSLGVGYLTLRNTSRPSENGASFIDLAWLDAQPSFSETPAVRHVRLDEPLRIILNGQSSTGTVLKPARPEDPAAPPDDPGSGI